MKCITASISSFDFSRQVNSACDGLQAFEMFKSEYEKDKTYAVIFMDSNMPKMDGYETTHVVRTNDITNHIPIILLTATSCQQTKQIASEQTGTQTNIITRLRIPCVIRIPNHSVP